GCGKPISWRYPFVEALTGGLALLMVYRFKWQPEALIYFVLFALLLALSVIDIATFRLPDPIVLVGALFGLGLNLLLRPQFLLPMITGAGVGWGLMLFMYGVGWLMFRKETLGWGDIKLGGVIGLYLGPAYTAGMFAFAILLGAVIGGAILFFSRHGWGSRIPFGPYLAAGAFVSHLWGDVVWRWYLGFIYS
ncbi:MAG: prepilin peptidase, partial [bacterium]